MLLASRIQKSFIKLDDSECVLVQPALTPAAVNIKQVALVEYIA